MIGRVNDYYQRPASPALVEHFRHDIGLEGIYLEIFDDLRSCSGSTQLHADNVGLPLKIYNEKAGIVGNRSVTELIRLAEIGLKAEEMIRAANQE